jgi:hypothetical protein
MLEKSYQQTKVYSLFIGLKDGQSAHIGFVNVKEDLPPADFQFVEGKLWTAFTQEQRFEFGKFYVVAEVKRSANTVEDIASLFDEAEEIQQVDKEIADSETEDAPF